MTKNCEQCELRGCPERELYFHGWNSTRKGIDDGQRMSHQRGRSSMALDEKDAYDEMTHTLEQCREAMRFGEDFPHPKPKVVDRYNDYAEKESGPQKREFACKCQYQYANSPSWNWYTFDKSELANDKADMMRILMGRWPMVDEDSIVIEEIFD